MGSLENDALESSGTVCGTEDVAAVFAAAYPVA